jgi:hypothetical protein
MPYFNAQVNATNPTLAMSSPHPMIFAKMPAYRLCAGQAIAVDCFRRVATATTAIKTAMQVITNRGVNII